MNRKPYEKPAVVYKEKIEVRASACGSAPQKASQPGCTPPLLS